MKQTTPLKIPELKHIKQLAAGGNHILALDHTGNVYTWGDGAQFQLGRFVSENYRHNALKPALQADLYRHNTKFIAAGGYHSFAIDKNDRVWAWGLNNYGQTGVIRNAGQDRAFIEKPALLEGLRGKVLVDIQGGLHHSVACDEDGELLTWGRCDDGQPGIPINTLPKEDVLEGRILLHPKVVEGMYIQTTALYELRS